MVIKSSALLLVWHFGQVTSPLGASASLWEVRVHRRNCLAGMLRGGSEVCMVQHLALRKGALTPVLVVLILFLSCQPMAQSWLPLARPLPATAGGSPGKELGLAFLCHQELSTLGLASCTLAVCVGGGCYNK